MFDQLRPHALARRLTEIDCEALATRGVRGVMLDLDNTLTPWRSLEVPAETREWLERLRRTGLRACLLTNAAGDHRVRPVAESLELPWIVRALKPLPAGFRRAMTLLQTTPETTAMIGDQVFTDIFGGNRLGLYTILVEPLSPREALITKLLQRPLERLVGRTITLTYTPHRR